MITRILFGSAMLIFVGGGLAWDGWLAEQPATENYRGVPMLAILLVLLVRGFFEIRAMAAAAGVKLLVPAGIVGVVLLTSQPMIEAMCYLLPPPSLFTMVTETLFGDVALLLGVILGAVFFNQMCTRRVEGAISRIGLTTLAVLYLGVGGRLMMTMRGEGLGVLLLFLIAVKFTDIGAYFTGSFFGKRKLIPWLSPGKSWEGLIGGLLIAAGTSVLFWWAWTRGSGGEWYWVLPTGEGRDSAVLVWPMVAIFGVIVGLVGQFADLCESMLKRSAGVKDSGSLVPEFGGVLDILDSPLLAAPAAWLMLQVMGSMML